LTKAETVKLSSKKYKHLFILLLLVIKEEKKHVVFVIVADFVLKVLKRLE